MNEHAIYEAVGQKHQRYAILFYFFEQFCSCLFRPPVSALRKQWCHEIIDLIEIMWDQDPSDRPSMAEVVEELQRLREQYR